MNGWGRVRVGEQPCEGGRVTPPPGAGLGLVLLLLRRVVAIIAAAKAIGMTNWWSGSSISLRSAVRKKRAGRIVVSRNVIPQLMFCVTASGTSANQRVDCIPGPVLTSISLLHSMTFRDVNRYIRVLLSSSHTAPLTFGNVEPAILND